MIRVMREQHEATSLSRKNGVPSILNREPSFREGTPFSGSTISPRAQIRVIREQHAAPESVMRRLEIAGGRNRFGEANCRAVWGWSRLAWVGGKWEDRNAAGELVRECVELRRVPKYAPHDRWHIERWLPPEADGSPGGAGAQAIERAGGASRPALGAYSRRRAYDARFTLLVPPGQVRRLPPAVA